jgi:hypothetical protein
VIRVWLLALATCWLMSLFVGGWSWSLLILLAAYSLAHRQRGPRLFPAAMKDDIVRAQGVRCHYCGDPTHDERKCPNGGDCPDCRQFDHVRSWKSGGSTKRGNGVVSCQFCNSRKGAGSPAELKAKVLAEWRASQTS